MNRRSEGAATWVALGLITGCVGDTATLVDAEYWAFLHDGTTHSLQLEKIDPAAWSERWVIDCRDVENGDEEPLPDAYDVCHCADGAEPEVDGCKQSLDADRGDAGWPPVHEAWMARGGFHVVHEAIEPWRGEALITVEGDLQLSFHHELPGGEDMRLAILLDPDFAPPGADGDWLDQWALDLEALAIDNDGDGDTELEGDCDDRDPEVNPFRGPHCHGHDALEPFTGGGSARLYYLTAGGYQLAPTFGGGAWVLPDAWHAASANGRFAADAFHARPPRWGWPGTYDLVDAGFFGNDPDAAYYCHFDCLPDDDDPRFYENCVLNWEDCMQETLDDVSRTADESSREWSQVKVSQPGVSGSFDPLNQPLVHSNAWRTPDGTPTGLDGWVELHPSYVVIDGDLEVGGAASGVFQMVLDGDVSTSRWVVRGQFEIEEIREDRWGTTL